MRCTTTERQDFVHNAYAPGMYSGYDAAQMMYTYTRSSCKFACARARVITLAHRIVVYSLPLPSANSTHNSASSQDVRFEWLRRWM